MNDKREQLLVKNFPASLRNRLRLEALSRNITMATLLTKIVEEWLAENGTVEVNTGDDNS